MTIQVVQGEDATSGNERFIPGNRLAVGYDTGSGGIAWNPAQYASRTLPYPAVHIDQDPNAADALADVLDVEARAATLGEIVGWIGRARAAYLSAKRPGQRWPCIYLSMGNLDAAVAGLRSAGVIDVPFFTAQPGNTLAFATQRIQTATGPYPCVGVQYAWGTVVDFDAFSLDWITKVATNPAPPVVLQQDHWNWCRKCQGPFYGPNIKVSVCPAGGQHTNEGSGDYTFTVNPAHP